MHSLGKWALIAAMGLSLSACASPAGTYNLRKVSYTAQSVTADTVMIEINPSLRTTQLYIRQMALLHAAEAMQKAGFDRFATVVGTSAFNGDPTFIARLTLAASLKQPAVEAAPIAAAPTAAPATPAPAPETPEAALAQPDVASKLALASPAKQPELMLLRGGGGGRSYYVPVYTPAAAPVMSTKLLVRGLKSKDAGYAAGFETRQVIARLKPFELTPPPAQ